jgi:uncharacterized protein
VRIEDERESENVEDRRGRRGPGRRSAGLAGGGVLLVLLIALLTGTDPTRLLQLLQTAQPIQEDVTPATGGPPAGDRLGRFASVVLASTEDTWGRVFDEAGSRYEPPRLVLFDEAVDSACGFTSSAVGPFYCPADRKVYLDLSFFAELERRFDAPGDFAQAYVIAHEVGHHVQNLLGIMDQVTRGQRAARSQARANALSVRLELQADCFAGVWASRANRERQILEPGDIEEGLRAAAAIGDDRLQGLGQGYVQPESWTHGSSEQRATWLRRGLESADPEACRSS